MNYEIRDLKHRRGRGRSTVSLAAAVLAMVWIVAAAAPAQATPVLTNGSFEQGNYQASSGNADFETLNAGSTAITGWQVTAGSIDWIGTYWKAEDGGRSLDLSGLTAGTIAATSVLNTVAGHLYEVDFYMSGNPDGGPTTKELQVDVSGVPPAQNFYYTVTGANSRSNMLWTLEAFDFLAVSSTTTLSFISETSTAYGAALDNVSVHEVGGGSAVPEPVTMAGVFFGLSGLVGYVRRRARK